ncbi:CYTH domain-containing protein [Macrococcus animalis]|uniref:CYTH domain-containing protein n=1 Tax=Macrococcus animalis TaxID=3395467 RepID=UPI0039BF2810
MEELEIEFKNILDYSTYEQLKSELFETAPIITQTNFYIDTNNYDLKSHKCALRIRDNGSSKVMTLKIPQKIGIMEYTGAIDERIIDQEYIEQGYIPENIDAQLKHMNIPDNALRIFGALSTERREVEYKNGLLVLDASYYLDTSDYELEYEVSNFEEGQINFNAFLEYYNIEKRETLSKVQRFYNHYQKLTSKIL